MEITIRQATMRDRDAIWDFMRRSYGEETPELVPFKFPSRWNWQYADNPFVSEKDGLLPVWLAMDGERIAGHVGAFHMTLKAGEERLPGLWGCDLIVGKEYRGAGVGRLLLKAYSDYSPIAVHVSQARSTKRVWDKFGSVPLAPVSVMWKPMAVTAAFVYRSFRRKTMYRPWAHRLCFFLCRVLFLNYLIALAWRAGEAVTRPFTRPRRAGGVSVSEESSFGEEFDAFAREASLGYDVIAERSAAFVTWKYAANPFMKYRVVVARRNGRICGYAALRSPDPAELRIGLISDLFCARDDRETADALVREAIAFFGRGVDVIETLVSHDFARRSLRRLGFLSMWKTTPHFLSMDPGVRKRMMSHLSDWFLTYADHDLDQIHPLGPGDR